MMKILLDTHVWLWALSEPGRLSSPAREMLEDQDNALYLSVASAWEITIKYGLGKLPLPEIPSVYVPSRMASTQVTPLEVNMNHVLSLSELPLHHRDPFDRLIINQSRIENLALLTADKAFAAYDAQLIWAQ